MMAYPLVTFQKRRGDQPTYRTATGVPSLSNTCSSSKSLLLAGDTRQSAYEDAFEQLKICGPFRNSFGDSGFQCWFIRFCACVDVLCLLFCAIVTTVAPPADGGNASALTVTRSGSAGRMAEAHRLLRGFFFVFYFSVKGDLSQRLGPSCLITPHTEFSFTQLHPHQQPHCGA